MHVAITGGTGFLGKHLTANLVQDGHKVSILTRNPGKQENSPGLTYVQWLTEGAHPEELLQNVDAIVNLAGESISSGRWTAERKVRILKSRLEATDEVVRIIEKLPKKPGILVNASAVGYYGMSETETYSEALVVHASDFLASVVHEWEQKAAAVRQFGVRTVFARFGVILGNEGALPKMTLPYRLGIGGTIGSGKQWLSWVHVADAVGLIRLAIENEAISGPLNVTSPEPVKMKEAGQTIAEVIRLPHWMPVPAFAMKMALGEMSSLLLQGQRVLPEKAREHGYCFQFPSLKTALLDILK